MLLTLSQASISEDEFLLFKNYISKNSGIVISPEKSYLIETRLSKFLADAGVDSFGEFYDYVISNSDPSMPQKIINAITVNETQWFRNKTPWKVLEERLLSGFVDELASGKKARIRIWCAAVSTGQEVYSTVMCVDNYLIENRVNGINLSDFDFLATDISSRVLDIAKKGRYNRINMTRGLSDRYKARYFTENNSAWDIDPKIRASVRFERFNLQNDYQAFGLFDVIFCRNVLIYFSDALKKDIITRMYHSLLDGGVLFTGNYALYDLFQDGFDTNHYDNLTYYSKKQGGELE
ncbi:MAG: protein-glutamate O-methyltransferase CheR [Synergistaceae bacterium]|nr:protein-glutamate O-methyltransferase CheR [Synergistaceae bacterium]